MTLSTTDRRMVLASEALAVYVEDPDETHVCDLVTDLMHYCLAKDIDFDRVLEMARYHFEEELNELADSDS